MKIKHTRITLLHAISFATKPAIPLALFVFALPCTAQAAISPLGFSLLAPAQFPPERFSVVGARVSAIWGKHEQVTGVDLGLIGNMTEHESNGIAVSGIFNMNQGTATIVGLQAAGLANINVNKARIYGLQISAGLNSNQAESTLVGIQVGLYNHGPYMDTFGLQAGLYNRAHSVHGFQIGLVNVAESLHGFQIGLLNFNRTGMFAIAPILNVGF